MNTIAILGSFAVVGVVVSIVIEYTKNLFAAATATQRTLYMLGISVIGGVIVYFFHLIPTTIVNDVIGVIAAVNSAYVFLVQYLPNSTPSTQ
jgi:hypothetical protein